MKVTDDKAQSVFADDARPKDETGDEKSRDVNEQTSTANGTSGFIILFFLIGFIGSLFIGWVIFPRLLYSQKDQPFVFNHARHLDEVDDECNSCHFFRDDGSFSGIPTLSQCEECHDGLIGEDPNEITFVNDYLEPGIEVPWHVYARQPDCVFFSHAAHVKMGEMACDECHEPRNEMADMPVYEENRITGYSRDIWGRNIAGFKQHTRDRMKMDDCAECHERLRPRQTSVQTGKDACFVCHK